MRRFFSRAYAFHVILMIVIVGVILLWLTNDRIEDFNQQQRDVAHGAVIRLSEQISKLLDKQNHLLSFFVSGHAAEIRNLARNPGDRLLQDQIAFQIKNLFPEYLTFTLFDDGANPRYQDVAQFADRQCTDEVRRFLQRKVNVPVIHPNPVGFHYDILQGIGDTNEGLDAIKQVFSVSFHADLLSDFLEKEQRPGHLLMLVDPMRNMLIEVAAKGSRSVLMRTDYRLSREEQQQIIDHAPVAHSQWEIVDVRDTGVLQVFQNRLQIENTVLFFIYCAAAILLVVKLVRDDNQKRLAIEKSAAIEQNRKMLISVITHEFRTPVATIVGALNLLMQAKTEMLDDGSSELIKMAANNTKYLQLLIDDFLDLQRLESGNLQLRKEPTDIAAAIQRSIENNAIYGDQYSVKFKFIPPVPPLHLEVNMDVQRIEQVMANLLSNAAKYGGSFKKVEISIDRDEEYVTVNVTDHGPGIPEDFQAHVFDNFTMADSDTGKQAKGSGLGLSICKSLIEAHGGVIGFSTRPGSGTTFYFRLPLFVNEVAKESSSVPDADT